MFFGYEWESDSEKLESDFIAEIKERFPNVGLKDAFDEIKGYRQKVYLDETEEDNYFAWLIAFGWSGCSLLILMDGEKIVKLLGYLELAKTQYPENFKQD